jgi:protein-tyrosine-phosphatase
VYVLFLDESCAARAPIAEALMRHIAPWHDAIAAGWVPSHVRPEIKEVLEDAAIHTTGLRARSLLEVPLDDVELVVAFVPDEGRLRVPAGARRIEWRLPDPLSAPPDERREACEAARDEIERRLRKLVAELG